MKNDNNIFQVLVPTGILATSETVTNLVSGDIGFIDVANGTAVDKTDADAAKELQVVMLTKNNGMLTPPAVNVSRLNSITKKAYSAGVAAKVELTLPAIGSDSSALIAEGEEIGVTFAIEAGDSYQIMGTNQIRKHFYVLAKSGKVATAAAIAAAINADEESTANGGFILAAVGGTGSEHIVTVTFSFANDDESIPVVGKLVSAVVSHDVIGVNDNMTGSVTPAFAFAQGKGKYIQRLEKDAAGYNGGTNLGDYRYIPDNPEFEGFIPDAVATSNYDMYVLNFDLDYAQNSGYNDNYEIMIAVADSTLSTAVNDLLYNVAAPKKIGLATPA